MQRALAPRLVLRGDPSPRSTRIIAGADVAFDTAHGRAVGALVLLSWPGLDVIESVTVESPVRFPYVPGLLSFRETPVLLEALERAGARPELMFIDGHGYAHPRRFGFASHIGLLAGVPSIGIAKSRLIGAHAPLTPDAGASASLIDNDEVVGTVLRTRAHVRPIYVSVGNGLSLAAAEAWTLRCVRGYRVPEPTRLADRLTREAKQRMLALTLDAIIEQRAGERGRWEWLADENRIVFRHDLDPMPEHYGCSTELVNDSDGELLDVYIVDDRPRERGERLPLRIVDVLERADGDHKLLGVPVDVDPRAAPTAKRLALARKRIWAWSRALGKPVLHWGGEDAALALIDACRAGGAR